MVTIQIGTVKPAVLSTNKVLQDRLVGLPRAAPSVQKLLQNTVVGRQVLKQQVPTVVHVPPPQPQAAIEPKWVLDMRATAVSDAQKKTNLLIPQAAPGVQKLLEKTMVGQQVIKQQEPVASPAKGLDVLGALSGIAMGAAFAPFSPKARAQWLVQGATGGVKQTLATVGAGAGATIGTAAFGYEKGIPLGATEGVSGVLRESREVLIERSSAVIPDIFGGLKDIGKWVLIGGAVILGAVVLMKLGGKK